MCNAIKKYKTNYSRTKKKKQKDITQNQNKPLANHKTEIAPTSQSKKDNLKWIDELELIDIIFDD
ncbi:MAG TPA: hypothetical protein VFD52_08985 [Clostridia bacterium]|nr:hypothetical protein [Clostridia bacterium]